MNRHHFRPSVFRKSSRLIERKFFSATIRQGVRSLQSALEMIHDFELRFTDDSRYANLQRLEGWLQDIEPLVADSLSVFEKVAATHGIDPYPQEIEDLERMCFQPGSSFDRSPITPLPQVSNSSNSTLSRKKGGSR